MKKLLRLKLILLNYLNKIILNLSMGKLLIDSINDVKNNRKGKRNNGIDIIKSFACMSVVYIHCSFPGFSGKFIQAINRYAVPFFFFTSGYYFLDDKMLINNSRIIKKIKHLLMLLRKIGIFYFIFCIIFNKIKNKTWSITALAKSSLNKQNIIRFIFLNYPFRYLHIWFILALLYCYIFMLVLNNLNSNIIKNSIFEYFSVIFGIIGYHLLTEFKNIKLIKYFILNFEFKINISILFIFRALPFFMIGIIVRKNKFKAIKPFYEIIILIFGSILSGIEMMLFKVSLNAYIGTYFQLISLISFCLKERSNYNKFLKIIIYIGRELSDKIYIYHIAIKLIIFFLLDKKNIIPQRLFQYIAYIFVLLISIIFSYIIKILTNIKIFKFQ